MKTKEELNALKEEVETMNKKLAELTEKKLSQISGGVDGCCCSKCGRMLMVPGHCPVCQPHVKLKDKSARIPGYSIAVMNFPG